ncbi:uncharacterized protein LOC130804182 isoform X2 [Amaranthus tricolor]|uniref:uncharacterized protein LOC130804182 isoform X2 n=1 Tax=Amaranthus tricolor TaxID=29722 RepID=UPI00258994F8|nr:uncharacterized protein LOC130804182 isoform X2 [Amaranthus tricolor]
MERLRGFLSFKTTPSIVFPTTSIFTRLSPRFLRKAKGCASSGAKQGGKRKGLVSLYKDKELCAGYADIDTMWRMIHSTCTKDIVGSNTNCKRPKYLLFCFKAS